MHNKKEQPPCYLEVVPDHSYECFLAILVYAIKPRYHFNN